MMIGMDIGNTNVTLGLLEDAAVLEAIKLDTLVLRSKSRACRAIREKLSSFFLSKARVDGVYVCSVVPALNRNARGALRSLFQREIVVIGEDAAVPIMNRYRIPSHVGQDRLVNAYAGLKIYGPGLIVVDFGTAITFDIVSKKSEYLGGLIVPGLRLMQEALNKKTALLPFVEMARPIEIIGGDTVSSIRAGIIYGVAALCDGIIRRLKTKECRRFKVIATGGDAHLIRPYSSCLNTIEDHLVLKGLAYVCMSQTSRK